MREFKARVRAEGLYIDYNSVSDFARSWRQQLDMAMNNLLGSDFLAQVAANPASREVTLKPELCTILLLASMEVRSNIILSRTSGGHQLYAGGRLLSNGNDGRSEARWDGALDQLEDIGFAEDCGHKREVFRLTASGYEAADDLWHVFLLRLISERQGDDDHEYTDIMELTNTLVFDRKMTIEFARERIECLVKSEHLEGVQTERSVSAARLTDAGRKFIREHSWLDFAVPDVAASER
ncbi:MAG: hypothetical protein HYV60_19180 [Planctomycetia bacterium]|nr:hypothetical protein [Planctomycetia bacterium]